jgi:hypothetical protein
MQYASNRNRVRAPMRRQALLLLAVLALAGSSVADEAGGLYVICHPSVTLSASDLRDVFLGEKQFAGAVRLAPADNSAARDAFLEKVLRMDIAKYLTAWTKKSFRDGVNPPTLSGSNAEALEYVRRGPGRCSYITTPPGPGVQVVATY